MKGHCSLALLTIFFLILQGCLMLKTNEINSRQEIVLPNTTICSNGNSVLISFKRDAVNKEISFCFENDWGWLTGYKVYKIEYKSDEPDFPFVKLYFYRGDGILADMALMCDYYWRMTDHSCITINENEIGILALKKNGQWEKIKSSYRLTTYFFNLGDRLVNFNNNKYPFSNCFKPDIEALEKVCKTDINRLADQ